MAVDRESLPPATTRRLLLPVRQALEASALEAAHPRLTPADYLDWQRLIDHLEHACRWGAAMALVELDLAIHRRLVQRAEDDALWGAWQCLARWTHPAADHFVPLRASLEWVATQHRRLLALCRDGHLRQAQQLLRDHLAREVSLGCETSADAAAPW